MVGVLESGVGGCSFLTTGFRGFRVDAGGADDCAAVMPFVCMPFAGVMRRDSDWNVLSLRFLAVTGLEGSVFALLPVLELGCVLLAELAGAIA